MHLLKVSVMVLIILSAPCVFAAEDGWDMRLVTESNKLIETPFKYISSADMNRNGLPEIVAADFGRYGSHFGGSDVYWQQRKHYNDYNLFILEWDGKGLKTNFSKNWGVSNKPEGMQWRNYFYGWDGRQMLVWEVGDRVMVETTPPYLGIEWKDGKYQIYEQINSDKRPLVGSWAIPWLGVACHYGFGRNHYPEECFLGIRDFNGDGKPVMVTEVVDSRGGKFTGQTLRVREYKPGFPIIWEKKIEDIQKEVYSDRKYQDFLNGKSSNGLLFGNFRNESSNNYIFDKDRKGGYSYKDRKGGYSIRQLPLKKYIGLYGWDLYDSRIGKTRRKDLEEYWGYRDNGTIVGKDFILELRRVNFKTGYEGFETLDVEFPTHDNYLNVGYFDLGDLDGDGLDEVVLVEETAGKVEYGRESVRYDDIKDYIRILKWDGKQYKTMWVSEPYTRRLGKFLITDVKGSGRNQLVVFSPNGTVQIWEMGK